MRFSPSIQWVFKVQDAFSPESISARGQVFRSCTSFLWLPNRKVNFSSHSEEEKVFCDGRSSRMPKTQHQKEITQPMPYTETQQILWQLTRLPSATALLCSSACTCSGLCPRQSLEWDSLSLSTTVPLFTGALCASSPGSTGIKLCPQRHTLQLNDGWRRDVQFTDPAILFLKYFNASRWSRSYIQATGK